MASRRIHSETCRYLFREGVAGGVGSSRDESSDVSVLYREFADALTEVLAQTPQAWLGAADLREPSERDRKQRGNDYDLADEPDLARVHAVLDGRISDTDKVAAPAGMGEGNSFAARNQA